MSATDLARAVAVLRDEVLDTAEQGDRDPPGAEVFEAIVRSLAVGGESGTGLDLQLQDSVSRRLAWGDREETVVQDAELVFERLLVAAERAFRDPSDQMVVLEAALAVSVTVARVVALAAVTRATRDRAARLREEMAQGQLREVLEKQKANIARLEQELQHGFR
ncbi:MAG TPA: hypothetical protein VM513_10400 [Kofleriaceae bacterium]|jgi:hypothetical protein|nr:hypothetical protein [Kofleriaceae bacterium]